MMAPETGRDQALLPLPPWPTTAPVMVTVPGVAPTDFGAAPAAATMVASSATSATPAIVVFKSLPFIVHTSMFRDPGAPSGVRRPAQ
jgi:hypothetical protein